MKTYNRLFLLVFILMTQCGDRDQYQEDLQAALDATNCDNREQNLTYAHFPSSDCTIQAPQAQIERPKIPTEKPRVRNQAFRFRIRRLIPKIPKPKIPIPKIRVSKKLRNKLKKAAKSIAKTGSKALIPIGGLTAVVVDATAKTAKNLPGDAGKKARKLSDQDLNRITAALQTAGASYALYSHKKHRYEKKRDQERQQTSALTKQTEEEKLWLVQEREQLDLRYAEFGQSLAEQRRVDAIAERMAEKTFVRSRIADINEMIAMLPDLYQNAYFFDAIINDVNFTLAQKDGYQAQDLNDMTAMIMNSQVDSEDQALKNVIIAFVNEMSTIVPIVPNINWGYQTLVAPLVSESAGFKKFLDQANLILGLAIMELNERLNTL